ncbi:MAG: hypothetical protein N5P05_001830 [Chroococcopsis gigantea SAG 12.99]|jgi:hypothetical protein|nr:hypothetical protein [Chlorogloea purpurea SAG 13.99]MDV3000224.1 hypothetical protein [Chroococcopsis gigantea SAG 12.99]
MKIYTINELEAEGIEGAKIKTEFKINCFNKQFIRVSDVAKRFKSKAIDACEEYEKQGLDCFVVETPLFFSVWKEERVEKPKVVNYSNSLSNYRAPNLEKKKDSEENIPVESSRKYRGTETTQPKIVIPVGPKPGRKYRGVDYS